MIVLDEVAIKNLKISYAEATHTNFESTCFVLGQLQAIPNQIASVSSRVPGRLTHLSFTIGDVVQQGEVLAILESRQPGNPPPSIPLLAPISGMITQLEKYRGDPLEPEHSFCQISDLTQLEAVAQIPEHIATQIHIGSKAHITINSISPQSQQATLLRFATKADPSSHTIGAFFRIPNPKLNLRPNMHAEFQVVLSQRSNVLSIPRSALLGDATSPFVMIKDFDLPNTFLKTPIVVGEINDQWVEIISGLLPTDEVITHGAYPLSQAGTQSISLKEALDKAHGHEHTEEGKDIKLEKLDHSNNNNSQELHANQWQSTTFILLGLLSISVYFHVKKYFINQHS